MSLDPARVGYETPRAPHTILAAEVRAFADAIGDPNPLFHDPERARAAGFRAALAPPTFVARFLAPFEEMGVDPRRSQLLHAEQEYEYTRPLHVGDQLEVWHRLASLRQSHRADGMALVTIETIGATPDGERLFTGRALAIVRQGDPAAAAPQRAVRPGAPPQGEPVGPLAKRVTREQIRAYADASGDHNPIHLDAAAARAVGLDGVIAHGMLSMAFLGQVVTDWLAARPEAGLWVARLRARFQAMARPGDTLTCRGELAGGGAGFQLWAENESGERVTSGDAEVAPAPR